MEANSVASEKTAEWMMRMDKPHKSGSQTLVSKPSLPKQKKKSAGL